MLFFCSHGSTCVNLLFYKDQSLTRCGPSSFEVSDSKKKNKYINPAPQKYQSDIPTTLVACLITPLYAYYKIILSTYSKFLFLKIRPLLRKVFM